MATMTSTLLLLVVQLVAFPNLGSSQLPITFNGITTSSTITPTPTSITSTEPPPMNDTCVLDETASTDESTILNQLKSRQQPNNAPNNNPMGCQGRPLIIPHTVPDELHRPLIFKGSCDCLFCPAPKKCTAVGKTDMEQCVKVYKKINGFWTDTGTHKRQYVFQWKCRCQ